MSMEEHHSKLLSVNDTLAREIPCPFSRISVAGGMDAVCGRLAPKGDGHRHHLVEETHQKTEEN